ncbi:MAG: hypothetical protein ABIK43_05830 [candidate division WOR-3 bacterium]
MSCRYLLTLLCLFCACSNILYRAGGDYFPLNPGCWWKYLSDTDTVYVSVQDEDTVVKGRFCRVVFRNFYPEYWIKGPEAIEKFHVRVTGRPNTEDTLEARFGTVLALPLVDGSSWNDVFRDTIVIRGTDTIPYEHSLSGRVSMVDSISTPAGTFYDCYRVDFTERIIEQTAESTASVLWFAPGVGIVRRQTADDDEVLVEWGTE